VTNALRAFMISVMPVLGLGRSCAGCLGESLEEAAPVAFSVKDATHLITTRPIKVETAMLEFDARSVLAVGDEAQLEFRLQIRVVLPVRGDLPVEHQTRVLVPTGRRCPSHTCFHHHRVHTNICPELLPSKPVRIAFLISAHGIRNGYLYYCVRSLRGGRTRASPWSWSSDR